MQFATAFLILAAAITGAVAAPSAEPVEVQARDAAVDITICSATNFGGDCVDATVYAQHDCC